MLSPVLIAPQSIQKMRDWANKFGVAVLQMVKAGTLLSNVDQKGIQPHALLSFELSGFKLQQKKGKNRQRGKWDIRVWFPSRDEETDESFPDNKTGCDDGGIPSLEQEAPFIMEDFPASEEVFASTAELHSVNFSLFSLLWNQWDCCQILLFYWYTCWHCYLFLWYWPVSTKNMFFHDHS